MRTLGLTAVNRAVIESHYAGIVTSASLITNSGTVDDGMRQLKGWSMSSRPLTPARSSRPLLSLPPAQMAIARCALATDFLTRAGPVRGRNLRQIFSERDEGPMVDESLARVSFV